MKTFLTAWCICAATILSVALLVPGLLPQVDFSCFYTAGFLLRTNPSQLYNASEQQRVYREFISNSGKAQPFLQPAFTAVLYAPFSLFTYRIAYTLFLLCNLALLFPCFLLTRMEFSQLSTWQPRPGLSFFIFVPLLWGVLMAQLSILVLFLCCVAWHELKRENTFNAGLCLALGLVKFQFVLPLIFLLAIRHGRRLMAGFASGALLLAGISVISVGLRGTAGLIEALRFAAVYRIPALMPNLRGLIYAFGGKYLPSVWQLALTLALSAILFLWVAWLLHREEDCAVAFGLSIIAALLLSYHLMIHDITVLLLGMGVLGERRRAYSWLTSACFILPALLFVLPRLMSSNIWVITFPLLEFVLLIARDQRSGKAFNCSSASSRMDACRFANHKAINRSDSHGR